MLLKPITVFLIVLMISAPLAAQRTDPEVIFRDAMGILQQAQSPQETAQGVTLLREAATLNHREAMFFTGLAFREGQGVGKDLGIALYWIQKAAEAGEMRALNLFAGMYLHGEGVVADPLTALRWYERGARAGDVVALHNAATILATGQAGFTDYQRAQSFLETAARLGHQPSQEKLPLIRQMIEEEAIAPLPQITPEGRPPGQAPSGPTTP